MLFIKKTRTPLLLTKFFLTVFYRRIGFTIYYIGRFFLFNWNIFNNPTKEIELKIMRFIWLEDFKTNFDIMSNVTLGLMSH